MFYYYRQISNIEECFELARMTHSSVIYLFTHVGRVPVAFATGKTMAMPSKFLGEYFENKQHRFEAHLKPTIISFTNKN